MKHINDNGNDPQVSRCTKSEAAPQEERRQTNFTKLKTAFGWITGAHVLRDSVGTVPANVFASISRIGSLATRLFKSKREKSLVKFTGDESQRFRASMAYHRIDEAGLEQLVRNTKKNFTFYFGLLFASLVLGVFSVYFYPPVSAGSGLFRFVAVPILGALSFKHAYSNWMFRHHRLSPPMVFFRSGDIWPKLS